MDPIEQARHRTLVARCQLGDRRALEDLFLRHGPRLGYYLRGCWAGTTWTTSSRKSG